MENFCKRERVELFYDLISDEYVVRDYTRYTALCTTDIYWSLSGLHTTEST